MSQAHGNWNHAEIYKIFIDQETTHMVGDDRKTIKEFQYEIGSNFSLQREISLNVSSASTCPRRSVLEARSGWYLNKACL